LLRLGDQNKLKVLNRVGTGYYLQWESGNDAFLPISEAPEGLKAGDMIDVFVYEDTDDSVVATTQMPLVKAGQVASLKVLAVEEVGVFLDWGVPKDLFLPHREMTRDLELGHFVIVYVYIDKSNRMAATMRVDKYINKTKPTYQPGDKVDLMIFGQSDLGFKAVINGVHTGQLYNNEIFERLTPGQRLPGYVKKVREDGKIDLLLQPFGNKGAKDLGEQILAAIKDNNGFLPITDKTTPDEIYDLFGVSKKKYKIALGGLYKKRLITISDDGIKLV
jgi:predicted RNA-binding protein (virulence factor B family)